jgi:hypothetical protein
LGRVDSTQTSFFFLRDRCALALANAGEVSSCVSLALPAPVLSSPSIPFLSFFQFLSFSLPFLTIPNR